MRAIQLLRHKVESLDEAGERAAREEIAILCGYIQASVSCLHRIAIPPYQTKAFEAAQDIDWAAIQVLRGLDGDFGRLSEAVV